MRFVVFVWLLILSSLVLFTLVVFFQELVAPHFSPVVLKAALLVATWTIGLVSAGAVHLMYRRAERAIDQAARNDTVVQLAGGVAHELNQPLTMIISAGELLNNHDRSPEEMRVLADRMVEAALRMSGTVDKLQGASTYRSKHYVGNVRIVDLDEVG
jgi:signal transduction histidine kinase